MTTQNNSQVELVNQLAFRLRDMGVVHLNLDDTPMSDRRIINLGGREILNFSSCNYVGLEADERLKQAAIEGIERFGTQYYCVRAYTSLNYYEELEAQMKEIFGYPSVVMPTTMLGHISCLPSLISSDDAVILDHQVHTSVILTSKILKANGTHVEMIRHNRMDYLESRIQKLSTEYRKIWYLADGVYSMYGNFAPMSDLHELMNRYGQFHLYIDDSHGMSWTGKHGSGSVIERMESFHPQMVLMTSLGKAFGASGGVAVFHDQATRELIRNTGSPLIFTGPLQPATLAAAVASAKIHLSDEMVGLQNKLKSNINYFAEKAQSLGLPVISKDRTPIFFLGVSRFEVGGKLVKALLDAGFFSCIACYPSVPYNNTGIRFLVTLNHTKSDIDNLLETIAVLLPEILESENFSMEQIMKAFYKDTMHVERLQPA
ncbi:MAG: aminotransferase class I/II-fold pyridoxal phosphate-dependent enzyme [Saprospiraceae bacterium]|nr:aminotransferase class I/II-fold pyridoxal phosphate-dependent enzyme [Saprospiraceae bacterium]MCF8252359.1 aminotransferase class I/II-fold pyridoxal phosphate-dependent enzyme [Saprospiraceae bacterium]MCF8282200.1 aminotransferase class I/II-fold pyridoxal phosphate-dependent enzyme [Bacteroidales bacterium]MCF8311849.1 aminotransferase class I/II-fold pyridoxal phosphate-dependent enzyme [Saprospiraceae bacterium]MCF8442693.1 aminotransferase class I/II-fold pyridoxal phosphate-dependen